MITSNWYGPGHDHSTALEIRRQVFQNELNWTPENDVDYLDPYAFHLVLNLNDVPIACGRILYGGKDTAVLDRICVLKKYRRQGIGDGLVKILDYKASTMAMKYSKVTVPSELKAFFERIGFRLDTADANALVVMIKETNDGSNENCSNKCSCS